MDEARAEEACRCPVDGDNELAKGGRSTGRADCMAQRPVAGGAEGVGEQGAIIVSFRSRPPPCFLKPTQIKLEI